MSNKEKLFLGIILLLALFFRLWQIKVLPGGLFPDEAANGLDINLMEQGHLQPFYERGNGREALFFYMLWGSVKLFGRGAWQHHIVSALVGFFSVALCFLTSKRLFHNKQSLNNRPAIIIALLSAFFMATSAWHIALSRVAFRAILIPLFSSLTVYLFLCAFEAKKIKHQMILAFLCGASFALGFYTYIAFRIMVPVLFVIVLWPLFAGIKQSKFFLNIQLYWKRFFWFFAGFAIFIYPLAKYFITHPGSFVGRSGQVSVLNPELNGGDLIGTILEVFRLTVFGFFTQGDLNWRHNISALPFLPVQLSVFFGAGLILLSLMAMAYFFMPNKKSAWWPHFVLIVWFWGMLLPVVSTAEGIPHGLRSIGVIPPVFIITGWTVYMAYVLVKKLFEKIYSRDCLNHIGKSFIYNVVLILRPTLAVTFFLSLIAQAYIGYFIYAANSPEFYYAFRSDLTAVSQYLNEFGDKTSTYLVLDKFSVQTTDYETTVGGANPNNPKNQPYIQTDPEDAYKLTNLTETDQIVFTQSSIFDIWKFKQYHPSAHLVLEYRNKFGQAIMAVYKMAN